MKFTGGEKLILLMLSELYEKTGVNGDINPDFIKQVIFSGHTWALPLKYPGLFEEESHEENITVSNVIDILDMWSFIEDSFESLSQSDQDTVNREANPHSRSLKFPGFDGNKEGEHMSIAEFLVTQVGMFREFENHDFNSHRPTINEHSRMLSSFENIRARLDGRLLNADELIEILRER